jgi:hypothetical protein
LGRLWTGLGFSIAFAAGLLIGYWGRDGDPLNCLLANHECSAAVATWTLNIISAAAFVAALLAGMYAKRAYDLETKLGLGQGPCDDDKHKKPRATRYIEAVDTIGDYTSRSDQDFVDIGYDFLNLGRSSLEDVQATMQVYWLGDWYASVASGTDRPSKSDMIDVGPIPTDCSAHVSIKILKSLISSTKIPFIGWSPDATVKTTPLAFTAYQYILVYQSQNKATEAIEYYQRRSPTKNGLRSFAEKIPTLNPTVSDQPQAPTASSGPN